MITLTTLDGISDEHLDKLVELWGNYEEIRISDERKTPDSFDKDKTREYFLITKERSTQSGAEWTFIWISNNLWQFRFCNTYCSTKGQWANPVDMLNSLLNGVPPVGDKYTKIREDVPEEKLDLIIMKMREFRNFDDQEADAIKLLINKNKLANASSIASDACELLDIEKRGNKAVFVKIIRELI